MSALRKNVASQVVTFNLVNATTGAALTGATVTTKVALDGTQSASAGTLTELGTGQYKYVPTQGETNGTSVGFSFTATNAVPVNIHCFTIGQDPTQTTLQADVAKWLGTAVSTPTVAGVPNVNAKTWNDLTTVDLPLAPTTAGRKLDVTATGAAGIDWANIENPTTAVDLSATNIDVDQVVASVSGAVGSVTGAVGSVTGAVGSVTGAVGSVTGNVGGNVVGSVGSVTGNVGGNVVGSVASVTAGVTLTAGERTSVADALLDRDMATGTDSGSPTVRTVRQALRFLRNLWAISGTTLTVYKEDDSTSSWTATVTKTAGDPVSQIDPAS